MIPKPSENLCNSKATNNNSVRSILRFLSDGGGLRNSSCIHSLSINHRLTLSSHLIRAQYVTGVIGVRRLFV
jgi:hypothetical protein